MAAVAYILTGAVLGGIQFALLGFFFSATLPSPNAAVLWGLRYGALAFGGLGFGLYYVFRPVDHEPHPLAKAAGVLGGAATGGVLAWKMVSLGLTSAAAGFVPTLLGVLPFGVNIGYYTVSLATRFTRGFDRAPLARQAPAIPFALTDHRYVDPVYGFSVALPAEWRSQQLEPAFVSQGGVLAIESPDGTASFNVLRGPAILRGPEWQARFHETFLEFKSQFRNTSAGRSFYIQLAGETAIGAEFRTPGRGRGEIQRIGKVGALHRDVEYVIHYTRPEVSDVDIAALLGSWQFVDT